MKFKTPVYLTLILHLIAIPLGDAAEPETEIRVVCVGDIMLAGSAEPVIDRKGVDYPFEGTRHILQAADIAIGNLEMPIATVGEPAPEKEYTFRGHPRLAAGIANAGFDVLTLANNHTGDYGDAALLEMLEILGANKLKYCGAGAALDMARKPATVQVKGKRVAVLAYANTFPFEFFAGEDDPGTVRGMPEFFVPDIKAAKRWAELVIVSFHWGGELVTEPRDYQEAFGRRAIDAGADLVFGHHPHVLQGIEVYNGKLIAYSLGNFAFASYSENAKTSAILQVTFRGQSMVRAELIPINVFNLEVAFQPKVLKGEAAESVFDEVRALSEKWGTQITTEGNVGVIQIR
ncbi:MAG: CapA family protein [Candidatus Poribacteria bacterium]|nr:CapA family protein [Candidatus Poribacteria bacterium]